MQQVDVDDKVQAVNYTGECDRPEFRSYTTYVPILSQYAGPIKGSSSDDPCDLPNGTLPTDKQHRPPHCIGAIDLKFDSLLVTKQTSSYSKSRVTMFTDEGGIIGAVMFVTWFFGIFNL